jgi:hypothetical protein
MRGVLVPRLGEGSVVASWQNCMPFDGVESYLVASGKTLDIYGEQLVCIQSKPLLKECKSGTTPLTLRLYPVLGQLRSPMSCLQLQYKCVALQAPVCDAVFFVCICWHECSHAACAMLKRFWSIVIDDHSRSIVSLNCKLETHACSQSPSELH